MRSFECYLGPTSSKYLRLETGGKYTTLYIGDNNIEPIMLDKFEAEVSLSELGCLLIGLLEMCGVSLSPSDYEKVKGFYLDDFCQTLR